MRVTANTFSDSLINQLNQLTLRQNRLQSQAATGQRVKLPDDDPTAMRRVLDLQAEAKSVGQYDSNITRLKDSASAAFAGMKSLKTLSDRAGEIATLADGTKSPDQLAAYANEIDQMLQQTLQVANTRHGGDFIFAGTRNDHSPFVATTDASGRITSVAYNGNASVASSEISDSVTLSAQTVGANASGTGPRGLLADSRTGADFFQHLISLRDHLTAGDTAAVASTDRGNLSKDEDNFIYHYGTNGAIQARLEAAGADAQVRTQSIETLVSKEADADLAATIVRLNETQNAYRAALQSGGTILNQSLLDYLH